MTLIRTHEGEHDVRSDADALDTLSVEVHREGASGADVAMLADAILDARSDHYGTGISTARPVVALLTTRPGDGAEAFAGYWQPDGTWRDTDGGPGGVELAPSIISRLSTGTALTPGAVISVTVHFLSFSGESPDSKTWTREMIHGGVSLPTCPRFRQNDTQS